MPYILAILRSEAQPAKASWLIWVTMDAITLAGMYVSGTVNGQIVGAISGASIVLILALLWGKPGWTKLDVFCMVGAAFGVGMWRYFDSVRLGLVINLTVLFLGSLPTFASAWEDPSRENRTAWTIFWASCVLAVIAIPQWTIADAGQPLIFFAVETIMMGILYFRHPEPAPAVS